MNRVLLDRIEKGRDIVLIIDEAQNLSNNVLEQIRLLSNLETDKQKLLQIVLLGQPELKVVLAQAELRNSANASSSITNCSRSRRRTSPTTSSTGCRSPEVPAALDSPRGPCARFTGAAAGFPACSIIFAIKLCSPPSFAIPMRSITGMCVARSAT